MARKNTTVSKKLVVRKGWPAPTGLSKAELVQLAMTIPGIRGADSRGRPAPDNEWSGIEAEAIADELERAGLKPGAK